MPTLHLHVPPDLMAQLKSSAAGGKVDEHAIALLQSALAVREARRAGGRARAKNMSKKERSKAASHAVSARWQK